MLAYGELLTLAYNAYVDNWCSSRGYRRDKVDPLLGINGECYVSKSEFEVCEFQDKDIMQSYISGDLYQCYLTFMK